MARYSEEFDAEGAAGGDFQGERGRAKQHQTCVVRLRIEAFDEHILTWW